MSDFRLLADDLTGALDSAARFVPRFGPIEVSWRRPSEARAAAYDSETREAADPEPAMLRWAPYLRDAALAFKKLDSMLRGHVAAEIAACLRAGRFAHAVIAPAFPYHGRITSGGRHYAHGHDVGIDLALDFARLGIPLNLCRPGDPPSPGVSLWDAVDDGDLDRIVTAGRTLPGPVLWCGSGGLAAALAGPTPPPRPALPGPMLALLGSDHPATAAQFAAAPFTATLLGPDGARAIGPSLAGRDAILRAHVPDNTPRDAAATLIGETFIALAFALPAPGTLVVTGGETLRRLCDALRASHLTVMGELMPGVPVSSLEGGAWDGVTIVSKSGAFGRPDFLARLFRA